MKSIGRWMTVAMFATAAAAAEPVRVAVMDFDDQTGQKSDAALGGTINPKALADKGIFVMGQQLLGKDGFTSGQSA